mmetsp:Transcript_5554/g.12471  ORF Transcript_5554/g.12471 Transcript_5554/m.12471 type:complete len:692 (-) Transcript_5554:152-2227(-)
MQRAPVWLTHTPTAPNATALLQCSASAYDDKPPTAAGDGEKVVGDASPVDFLTCSFEDQPTTVMAEKPADIDDEAQDEMAGGVDPSQVSIDWPEDLQGFIVPTQPDLEALAFFEGGPKFKVTICSANIGNKMIRDMDDWVPVCPEHTDLVVLGMQESTYKVKKEDSGSDEEVVSSDEDADSNSETEAEMTGNESEAETPRASAASAASVEEEPMLASLEGQTPRGSRRKSSFSGSGRAPRKSVTESVWQHHTSKLAHQLGGNFVLLEEKKAGQMKLFVYIRIELSEQTGMVTNLVKGSENTGVGHVLANKGGQAISFTLNGTTSFCFVNSHLAAHEGKCDKRNSNIQEIFEGLANTGRFGNKNLDIAQYDHTFWFGDMNYRTALPEISDKKLKHKVVTDWVAEKNYAEIAAHDELGREVREGRILTGFHSAPPNFRPTFKVKRGEGVEYNMKRTPSYCDRVLWHSAPRHENNIICSEFTSCEGFITSDHKPVRAQFAVTPSPVMEIIEHVAPGESIFPQIKFSNLKGRDLHRADGPGFKSDPYVVFLCNPPNLIPEEQRKITTKSITQTLNPDWVDEPFFSLRARNYEELEKGSFTLLIMDRDWAVTGGADDTMGNVTLALRDICKAGDTEEGIFTFEEPVIRYGEKIGTLSGTIEVNTPGPSGVVPFKHSARCSTTVAAGANLGCKCVVM